MGVGVKGGGQMGLRCLLAFGGKHHQRLVVAQPAGGFIEAHQQALQGGPIPLPGIEAGERVTTAGFVGLTKVEQGQVCVARLLLRETLRELRALYAELGWPAMHARLAEVDPVTAARLAPGDSQRIQRALEVWHVSGQPLSSFHTTKTGANSALPESARALFSLEPDNRAWLHERIAQRFDAMLAVGFIDEVTALRARGDLHPDLPSMRCVGYRQAWEALDGSIPMAELRDRGIYATRQLAKRQITWMANTLKPEAFDCLAPDLVERVERRVEAALAG